MNSTLKFALVLMGFLAGSGPKDTRGEETAIEVNCPNFTLLASPADGHVTLERVQALSECMGDNASRVCTVQVVRLKRSKQ